MPDMLIYSLSTPLAKGLQQGNSQAASFDQKYVIPTAPTGDGVWASGSDGQICPQRVFILPYMADIGGSGGQQQVFNFRVWGWRGLPDNVSPPQNQAVYIPFLLAEFQATSCNQPGLANRIILDTESFCDTITLTQGNLGANGFINSTGPGTDIIASCAVDLVGCRFFSFDFMQQDSVFMNVLFARA